jgi:hypothetical protein
MGKPVGKQSFVRYRKSWVNDIKMDVRAVLCLVKSGWNWIWNKVGRACGMHGRGEKSVQGFGGRLEGKRPHERPRYRWEDGIKMDFREIGWEGVEWSHLAQDRDWWWAVVNMMMNLQVLAPQSYLIGYILSLRFCVTFHNMLIICGERFLALPNQCSS